MNRLCALIVITGLISAPAFAGEPTAAQKSNGERTATAVLAVDNMTCQACPITVRKALRAVPGVTEVQADLKTQTATVHYDPSKTNVEALQQATGNAGYPSRPKTP